ncbi:hypothetical protein TNCV_2429531 [Trichonephila clavipes]|nr:hypothetical protein TNCV_2429531 [Trichonephila clavipes]
MKFVRDRVLDRLISLEKGKVSSKITELRKRQKDGQSLTSLCIHNNEKNSYLAPQKATENLARTRFPSISSEFRCLSREIAKDIKQHSRTQWEKHIEALLPIDNTLWRKSLHGQNNSAEKQWRTKSAHRRKKCPACCVLIGRRQSTQKVGVEMDWVDPKINDPKQGRQQGNSDVTRR